MVRERDVDQLVQVACASESLPSERLISKDMRLKKPTQ